MYVRITLRRAATVAAINQFSICTVAAISRQKANLKNGPESTKTILYFSTVDRFNAIDRKPRRYSTPRLIHYFSRGSINPSVVPLGMKRE